MDKTPRTDTEEETKDLTPVDYGGLVERAMGHEKEGLNELRRKAEDAGEV